MLSLLASASTEQVEAVGLCRIAGFHSYQMGHPLEGYGDHGDSVLNLGDFRPEFWRTSDSCTKRMTSSQAAQDVTVVATTLLLLAGLVERQFNMAQKLDTNGPT